MNRYMKMAIDEAYFGISNNEGGPFGAVIVKDGEIIGKGHNTVLLNHDPTAHAEINAIRDATKNISTENLEGATIYTTGYPCPMCFSALIWANIKVINYLNTTEEIANIGFKDDFIYSLLKNPSDYLDLNHISDEDGKKLMDAYKGVIY